MRRVFWKLADEWPALFIAWLKRRTEYEEITGLRAEAVKLMIREALKL